MNDIKKPGFLTYLYAFLTAVLLAVFLFVFSNLVDSTGSVVPFIIITVFDIANVVIVHKHRPRDCFGPFIISVLTFYLLYKIVAVTSTVAMYKADGFLTDGEFSHSYGLDVLMVSLMLSTYIFSVFLRFALSRQKLKMVSKVSVKRFVLGLLLLCVLGTVSLISWKIAEPYKNEYLDYVSTFSAEKWAHFPDSRINMFYDFETKYQLVGLDKSAVLNLLGNPEMSDDDTDCYKMGDSSQGHHTLKIKYENGTVLSYTTDVEIFMADVVEKVQNKN